MNGYQMQANAYREYLAEHPEETEETKEELQRKITALDIMANTDKATIYEMFNTGAFNDIAKGYFIMAANYVLSEAHIDGKTAEQIKENLRHELKYRFDTMTAGQAEQYYRDH